MYTHSFAQLRILDLLSCTTTFTYLLISRDPGACCHQLCRRVISKQVFVCQQRPIQPNQTKRTTLAHCRSFYIPTPSTQRQQLPPHHTTYSLAHDTNRAKQATMKPSLLISATALATRALATKAQLNAHDIQDLVARAIDPATMDPTRLSVLSVMRTAIPSGPDFPKPTDGSEPEWWQKLPADVKSLLPVLYPATETASVSVSSSSAAVSSFFFSFQLCN